MELLYCRYENVFSFKKVELDFKKISFALFVGRNGIGKSYFFDSLYTTFYGEVPRKKYNTIIRDTPNKKVTGRMIVKFKIGKTKYTIIRVFGRGKKLMLFRGSTNISLRNPTLTQERINEIIKIDSKTFLNVAYFSQGDVGKFLDGDSSGRIKTISNLLSLQVFDKAKSITDKDINEKYSSIQVIKGKLETYDAILKNYDIRRLNGKMKMMKDSLRDIAEELVTVSYEAEAMAEKRILLDKLPSYERNSAYDIQLYEDKRDEFNRVKSKRKSLLEKIKTLKLKIKSHEVDEESINVISEDIQGIRLKIKKDNKKLSNIRGKIEFYEMKIKDNSQIKKLKGKKCTVCNREITDGAIISVGNLIKEYETEIKELKETQVKISDRILKNEQRLEDIQDEMRRYDIIYSKLENWKSKLSEYRSDREDLKKQYNDGLVHIEDLKIDKVTEKRKLKKLNQDINYYKDYNLDDYEDTMNRKGKLIDTQNKIESQVQTIHHQIKEYNNASRKMSNAKKKYDIKSKEIDVMTFWRNTYPRIKFEMISEIIPLIQKYTNKYLSRILNDKVILFELNDEKTVPKLEIQIYDMKTKIKRAYEGWGGAQKVSMSLAICLALNKIASKRSGSKLNFLILDEKFSSLDTVALPRMLETLKSEQKGRKIMSISHLQDIDNYFDQVIKFESKNGVTRIAA